MPALNLICFAHLLVLALFCIELRRNAPSPSRGRFYNVSLVVAARNEQESIGPCLKSLASIDYPADLLEIIIVDDLSRDNTAAIVKEFMADHPGVRLVSSSEDQNNHLIGKTKALSAGISMATGDIIFVTDADCTVPSTWVVEMIKHYNDEFVGMVAGFTSLSGTGLFARIQALDWLSLVSYAAASARLGIPSTAVGNNLSFRRSAYDAVGGYKTIPFSVTEDLALVRAVTAKTPFTLAFSASKNSLVQSAPCGTWKEWYRQRTRWFLGGKAMSPVSKLIIAIGYVFNIVLVYLFVEGQIGYALSFLIAKVVLETTLVLPALSVFSRRSLLRILPLFQLYFFLYVAILPLLTIFRRSVRWKERTVGPT